MPGLGGGELESDCFMGAGFSFQVMKVGDEENRFSWLSPIFRHIHSSHPGHALEYVSETHLTIRPFPYNTYQHPPCNVTPPLRISVTGTFLPLVALSENLRIVFGSSSFHIPQLIY